MNKAIVIVDIPNTCNNCKFCIVDYSFWGDICESKCLLTEMNNIVAIGKEKIDKNCPLKPMQNKLDWKVAYVKDKNTYEIFNKNYVDGYNKCIDEILGDEE